ncbi:hypothetical protein AAFF_G00287370 [Aldrovandia affinis]|uniref:Reverse transcriptase domain-containing protein n=1 Tax=Aldrovandia affinis TaxID=143900 RepID=A0AAD7SSM5_9TELE|nr:hypothetical protein AAFF_G00287370 [Aldrovandia affinis]
MHDTNTIIKFADDTTVMGLIKNNDETAYREEIQHLATWCADNNLALNTKKTKELIVDFRKTRLFKFLGVHISEDLSWTFNTSSLVKKAHQRLFFLRRLRKAHLSPQILVNFYRCAIESILTNSIMAWYGNCTASDRKTLQRVVKTAQRITGSSLPAIKSIHDRRCLRKAQSIIRDSSHPNHGLFALLPSGRRYRNLRSKSSRLRNSFFPSAVISLNSSSPPHPPSSDCPSPPPVVS